MIRLNLSLALLGLLPLLGCGRCLPMQTTPTYVMRVSSVESEKRAAEAPTGTTSTPDTAAPPEADYPDPAEQERLSRYVVGAGDRLEIIYTESWAVEGRYRLLPGDRIRVEYLHLFRMDEQSDVPDPVAASGLDRDVLISPDGKIALPYIGAVDAAGLSVSELADRLNAKYQEYYLEPKMLVTLLETGTRLKDLREAIRTGGSRLVYVAPDGTINLPHLGIVPAAELTIGELQVELAERYRRTSLGFAVTVRLAAPKRVSTGVTRQTSQASSTATPESQQSEAGPRGE